MPDLSFVVQVARPEPLTVTAPQPAMVVPVSTEFTVPPAPGIVAVNVMLVFLFGDQLDELMPKLVGSALVDPPELVPFTVTVMGPARATP